MTLDEIESAQIDLLTKLFAALPVIEGEWRTLERAVNAIRAYNVRWPVHEWEVLGVEEEFEVKVGEITLPLQCGDMDFIPAVTLEGEPYNFAVQHTEPTIVDVILAGRKDLVVSWHDGIWVVDHKTASEWGADLETNQELMKGRRSFQFRGYAWAERELNRLQGFDFMQTVKEGKADPSQMPARLTLPVRGAIGNYIIGRRPFSEAASAVARRARNPVLTPRDDHHQEFFVFDDSVLDEWREECLLVAERILACWQTGRWEQGFDTACAHYGRCEYYDYCEESPSRREATLSSAMFRAKSEPTAMESDL